MQLLLNQTSPYARVARLTALEAGLGDRLELVWSDPWNEDAQLLAANPVNKVPVLITDEGIALSETLLICVYLHQRAGGGPLAAERLQLVWDRA
jgi:glutathione S-transferase